MSVWGVQVNNSPQTPLLKRDPSGGRSRTGGLSPLLLLGEGAEGRGIGKNANTFQVFKTRKVDNRTIAKILQTIHVLSSTTNGHSVVCVQNGPHQGRKAILI